MQGKSLNMDLPTAQKVSNPESELRRSRQKKNPTWIPNLEHHSALQKPAPSKKMTYFTGCSMGLKRCCSGSQRQKRSKSSTWEFLHQLCIGILKHHSLAASGATRLLLFKWQQHACQNRITDAGLPDCFEYPKRACQLPLHMHINRTVGLIYNSNNTAHL